MGTKPQPYTVMTVCTGNICRSPMAEIIPVSYTHLTLPTIA